MSGGKFLHEGESGVSRRFALAASLCLLGAAATRAQAAMSSEPLAPIPIPPQAQAKEAIAALPGTRLAYWDTGGNGEAIVLLHPATGSARIWSYQQPVFVRSGYRVIAYSRRGYGGSDPVPKDNPGTAAGDLHNLAELLGLGKFHLAGSAAGGATDGGAAPVHTAPTHRAGTGGGFKRLARDLLDHSSCHNVTHVRVNVAAARIALKRLAHHPAHEVGGGRLCGQAEVANDPVGPKGTVKSGASQRVPRRGPIPSRFVAQ
jgi:hypothetical protein